MRFFNQHNNSNEKSFLFDYSKYNFINEKVLEKYLLQGYLMKDVDSSIYQFMIFSSRDNNGNNLMFNFDVPKLSNLMNAQNGENYNGFRFGTFPCTDELFDKSQWVSNFEHICKTNKTYINIISGKSEYELEADLSGNSFSGYYHNSAKLCFDAGPFQYDKLGNRKVLFSDITFNKLEEVINTIYEIKKY